MAPQPPPFPYDPATNGGHFGASSAVAQSGYIPATAQFNSTFQNVTNGLQGQYRNVLATYWQHVIHEIENEEHDFKIHQLPLARIKVPVPRQHSRSSLFFSIACIREANVLRK